MTRDEINDLALSKIDNTKCLILELSTGTGKSRIAINCINKICDRVFKRDGSPTSVLLLVAKKVHKQNWIEEIKKWGGLNTDYLTIECYESLRKYKNQRFDVICLDEAHHLSNSRREILETIHVNECIIGLSATIKQELKDYLFYKYNAEFISCGITEAIENNILPEPTIYLLPLELDTIKYTYKAKKFKKDIIVTQQGYYNTISSMIDWYKEKYMRTRNQKLKNVWLASAGNRLKWLSEQKESIILSILDMFKNRKTLTFCSSMGQSKRLGKYNITSKNNKSEDILNKFNNNKIKHITSVNILNEGMNLTNCQIGIFANINASEIINKQRIGRILRHKSPIIIIPYYVNTREEELVNNMIEDYNKDIVKTINNIKEITL